MGLTPGAYRRMFKQLSGVRRPRRGTPSLLLPTIPPAGNFSKRVEGRISQERRTIRTRTSAAIRAGGHHSMVRLTEVFSNTVIDDSEIYDPVRGPRQTLLRARRQIPIGKAATRIGEPALEEWHRSAKATRAERETR